jgi:asparagine synthase (glutamine-hydrolysing)
MCGIAGLYAYHAAANPVDMAELRSIRDHMAARGPDGRGEWLAPDGRVGLGNRRLAIIDLSDGGAQPMACASRKTVITFNGEIYNYRSLRSDLEAKGYVFRTQSDTEVLLHLYAAKGEAMVADLRGMFAFAIWDGDAGALFVARDPYGIKPLYYADDGRTFRFASQVRALIAGGAIPHELDAAGQVGFYLFGNVPEPFTWYRHIQALPAGCTLFVDRNGKRQVRRYHSIAQIYCDAEAHYPGGEPPGKEQAAAEVRDALLDSVRHHLVADVPVGAFLSSGIDSGAIVGLMRDANQRDIETVTLSFTEYCGHAEDEAPLADEVARLYGARHTTRVITESEFAADLPRILETMDQPSIDGINTWFVAKAAHELGLKVVLSGLGGDELFGGYPSFRDIPRWVRLLAAPSRVPFLGKLSRLAARRIGGALHANPKAASMIEFGGSYDGAYLLRRGLFMPWELDRLLDPELVRAGLSRLAPLQSIAGQLHAMPSSPQARVAVLEASLYMRNQLLRDTDWASMAHSLEVRTPLVDSVLLKRVAAAGVPRADMSSKQMLARAPAQPLPDSVIGRKKTGFNIPTARWFSRQNAAMVKSTFAHARRWACYIAARSLGGRTALGDAVPDAFA